MQILKIIFKSNLPKYFSYVVFPLYVYVLLGCFQCELSKVCIDNGNWYILVIAENTSLKTHLFSNQRSDRLVSEWCDYIAATDWERHWGTAAQW